MMVDAVEVLGGPFGLRVRDRSAMRGQALLTNARTGHGPSDDHGIDKLKVLQSFIFRDVNQLISRSLVILSTFPVHSCGMLLELQLLLDHLLII